MNYVPFKSMSNLLWLHTYTQIQKIIYRQSVDCETKKKQEKKNTKTMNSEEDVSVISDMGRFVLRMMGKCGLSDEWIFARHSVHRKMFPSVVRHEIVYLCRIRRAAPDLFIIIYSLKHFKIAYAFIEDANEPNWVVCDFNGLELHPFIQVAHGTGPPHSTSSKSRFSGTRTRQPTFDYGIIHFTGS